ncbi:putative ATP-grasp-modified RiPP [Kitasatospora sp. NPDC088160]|uniref:putative ATP-grasp-modified RiPP n=1 Tax=unclassified Kitasatospora TaxID=2633591 RepID=UPI0037FBE66B
MTRASVPPWGTTRMGPFQETEPVPRLTAVIDPETQVAVYFDDQGRKIELGAHGTSTNATGPTSTGGGDGKSGKQNQPTDVDTMTSNDQDQGTR